MFYKIGVYILSKISVILSVFSQLYKGFVETLSGMSKLKNKITGFLGFKRFFNGIFANIDIIENGKKKNPYPTYPFVDPRR